MLTLVLKFGLKHLTKLNRDLSPGCQISAHVSCQSSPTLCPAPPTPAGASVVGYASARARVWWGEGTVLTLECDQGMVWYGMVWYGMVWYGMVWFGLVWYGGAEILIDQNSCSLVQQMQEDKLFITTQLSGN